MKNKFLSLILAFCLIVPCMYVFVACGKDKNVDTNIYVTEDNTLESAINQVDDGGKIVLNTDVMLDTAMVITKQFTLNLNDRTISLPNDTVGDGVFHVTEGGKLTIEGDGVINGVGQNDYNMAIWADGGEVVINGGTFTNSALIGTDDHYDLIYAGNGSIVTINDGVFDCKTPKWTLNLKDNTNSQIIVKGGSFKNYNPASSQTENPVANFVAEGYTSTQITISGEIWYKVNPNQ